MIRRIVKKRSENRNSVSRNRRFERALNSRRHRKNESLAGYEGSISYEDFRSACLPSNAEALIDKKTGEEIRRGSGKGHDDLFESWMSYDEMYSIMDKYDILYEGDEEPHHIGWDDIIDDEMAGDQYMDAFKSCMRAIPCTSNQSLWWIADDVIEGNRTGLAIEEAWCQADEDDLCPRVGRFSRRDPVESFDVEDATIGIQIGYRSYAHVYPVVEADVAWEMGLFEDDPRIQKLIRHISDMNPKSVWNNDVAMDLIKKYLPCYNMKSIDFCEILIVLDYVEPGADYDDNMYQFCYQMQADPFYSILDMVYLGYK